MSDQGLLLLEMSAWLALVTRRGCSRRIESGKMLVASLLLVAILPALCQASTPASCHPITVKMCQNLPYNETVLPNVLGQHSQDDIAHEIYQYQPLIGYGCSTMLEWFLCFTYLPPCTVLEEAIPPCAPFCRSVRDSCETALVEFGFEWPEQFRCSLFPEDGLCIMPPEIQPTPDSAPPTTTTTTPIPTTPPTTPAFEMDIPSFCEVIEVPMCYGLSYQHTNLPNLFGHESQAVIADKLLRFEYLLSTRCSADLQAFLCMSYLPVCTVLQEPVPPCRRLCKRVRKACAYDMDRLGLTWPKEIRCDNLSSGGLCLSPASSSRYLL